MGHGLVAAVAGLVAEVEELWFARPEDRACTEDTASRRLPVQAQLPPSQTLVAQHLGRNSGGGRPGTRVGNHTPSDWGPPAQEALVPVPDILSLGHLRLGHPGDVIDLSSGTGFVAAGLRM